MAGNNVANSDGTHINDLIRKEWASYIEPLLHVAERMSGYLTDPENPQLRRELYRSLFAEISAAYFGLLYADARHPDFWPFTTQAFNAYMNNPDDDYYATPIDDDGVYRISGFRGTVRKIDFQIGKGAFLVRGVPDKDNLGVTLANYDLDDDAHVKPDGSFEVILSRERPVGYAGDWWMLGEGATNILNRQISYDWVNEIDGRYGIERLDVPANKPRVTAERLEADLKQIAAWTEGSMKATANFVQSIRRNQGVNKIEYWDLNAANYSALTTQKYVYGGFDLLPDEALLVEFKVPSQVRYWSFHLADDFGFILDWMHHQTIVSGFNAVVDKDGACRVVVSAQDPGTPNWLDTIGYKTGAMQIRWEKCNEYPDTHKVTRMKVSDVRKHLPPETGLVTPEQRDAAIRLRRTGTQMRKRW